MSLHGSLFLETPLVPLLALVTVILHLSCQDLDSNTSSACPLFPLCCSRWHKTKRNLHCGRRLMGFRCCSLSLFVSPLTRDQNSALPVRHKGTVWTQAALSESLSVSRSENVKRFTSEYFSAGKNCSVKFSPDRWWPFYSVSFLLGANKIHKWSRPVLWVMPDFFRVNKSLDKNNKMEILELKNPSPLPPSPLPLSGCLGLMSHY